MERQEKILIVEDEKFIRNLISTVLSSNGYEVLIACNGVDACNLIASDTPNLVVLDIGLPDIDGMDIIRQVRCWSQLPIVVVSARTHERDKVNALDLGADDYLTKPFGGAELLARVRTALRHAKTQDVNLDPSSQGIFKAGALMVDLFKQQVKVDDREVYLTQNEYKIVSLLARYSGMVLTYDFILREISGPTSGGEIQTLRVNMANIRRKIEKNPAKPSYLFTEVGVGYRMLERD